jgi:hypothetical protein
MAEAHIDQIGNLPTDPGELLSGQPFVFFGGSIVEYELGIGRKEARPCGLVGGR